MALFSKKKLLIASVYPTKEVTWLQKDQQRLHKIVEEMIDEWVHHL